MAVLTMDYNSDQMTQLNTLGSNPLKPHEAHGVMRVYRGYYKNLTGGTIATAKNISLCKIPRCRILPSSVLWFSAFGTARVLDIGWQEYKSSVDGSTVVSDPDGIRNDLDVSAAGKFIFGDLAALIEGIDISGQTEILVQTGGGTMPTNAIVSLELHVVVD